MTAHIPADAFAAASSANPTRFLDRPDGRIAYDEAGAGPLVIMVPGLGDLRAEYRFLVPQLVAAGHRAVTLDIRGHGESSTGWPDYTSAALGSDVVALSDRLGGGPATVIGTSMGAAAAAWAAAEAPGKVSGIVLIGPFVRDIPPRSRLTGLMQKLLIRAAFAGPWAETAWGAYYASLYPTRKPGDFAAYRAALVANLREPGRMDATRAMIGASKADVAARLAEVAAPALVVMGTKDPDFADPAEEAATVARRLKGSVRMIDGAGHYPHAEMPDIAGTAVVDFLRGTAG
jgi:pimeloyl-ACP methyl ester carboxylesterase